MAKAEKKKVSRITVAKKLWCRIISPKMFGQREMGEIYVPNADKALGRVLHYNLKELTGNVKDQSAYLTFKITERAGEVLHTSLRGYQLTMGSVKRMVRKNTTRLDDYYIANLKDGQKIIIKVLMITLHKTQRSVQARLRKELHRTLQEEADQGDFLAFMEKVVNSSLRSSVQKNLHHIYPVREIAIRSIRLNEKSVSAIGKGAEEKEAVVAEPEAIEALPA